MNHQSNAKTHVGRVRSHVLASPSGISASMTTPLPLRSRRCFATARYSSMLAGLLDCNYRAHLRVCMPTVLYQVGKWSEVLYVLRTSIRHEEMSKRQDILKREHQLPASLTINRTYPRSLSLSHGALLPRCSCFSVSSTCVALSSAKNSSFSEKCLSQPLQATTPPKADPQNSSPLLLKKMRLSKSEGASWDRIE